MNEPAFTVRPKGARICAALVLASAAVRLAWFLLAHGAGADAYTAIVHLALPELSCLDMRTGEDDRAAELRERWIQVLVRRIPSSD